MISVCLPSDALLQHLPSYLGFSYLGHGVSLHGCSSKAQPLLLTLDKGYLLTTAPPDLECGVAPLGPPALVQPSLIGLEMPSSIFFCHLSRIHIRLSLIFHLKTLIIRLYPDQYNKHNLRFSSYSQYELPWWLRQ